MMRLNTKLDFSTRRRLRLLTLPFLLAAIAAATDLRIQNGQVQAFACGRRMLASPPEGLWTIACDWRDQWPQDWQNARPGAPETIEDWTIVRGELNACGAAWQFQ